MFRYFVMIITNNVTKEQKLKKLLTKPLGRWSYVQSKQLERRVDLANHDHCGPCKITKNKDETSC